MRGENTLGIQQGQAHSIEVRDLLGLLIRAYLAADSSSHDAERDQGAPDHVEILRQVAERDVHVLIGLGEHVHRDLVIPVVLVKVDSLRRKGFVIAVVVLNPSLVYDDLGVLSHAEPQESRQTCSSSPQRFSRRWNKPAPVPMRLITTPSKRIG